MNRKDFRPNSNDNSSSKKQYNPVKPKRDVVKAFIKGDSAHTGNDSLTSDGKTLYSYNTAIAVRQSDGNVVVNNTKYSQTTSAQQSILMSELKSSNTKYDVTGGKDRGYQGEDFSKSEEKQLKADIKDEKDASKHYKEMSNDEKEHAKILEKQLEKDKSPKFTKEEKESLKRFANRKDKDYSKNRMSLSEMKERNKANGQYFFSKETLRVYKGEKKTALFNKKTGTNYIKVEKPLSKGGNAYYKYNMSNGHLDWISKEDYQKENQ